MIQVVLPSQLDSYTDGQRELSIDPNTLGRRPEALSVADVIAALDQRYPGLAFRIVDEQGRIRRHIAVFVGEQMVRELDVTIGARARLQIVGALSGG